MPTPAPNASSAARPIGTTNEAPPPPSPDDDDDAVGVAVAFGPAPSSGDAVAVGGASPGSSGYASHNSSGEGDPLGSCAHAGEPADSSRTTSPTTQETVRALTVRHSA